MGKFNKLLKEKICKVLGSELVSVALFGSLARGEAEFPQSDVDLLIVTHKPIRGFKGKLEEIAEALDEVFEELGITPKPDVDLHMLTDENLKSHPPITLDMTHDVIIIHDDEDTLKKELHKIKMRLEKLGAKKITLPDGSWYWILKPDLKLGEKVDI